MKRSQNNSEETMRLLGALISVCLISLGLVGSGPDPGIVLPAQFTERTIATDLRGGYQVVVADINHDGKPDLIALASGMKELVWFENPSWRKHTLIGNISQMINCAAWDTDGDGIPEIALAHEFAMDPAKSAGVLS